MDAIKKLETSGTGKLGAHSGHGWLELINGAGWVAATQRYMISTY